MQYAMNSYAVSQKYFYVLLIETTKTTNISYWNAREWSDYINDNLNWSLQVSVSEGNRYSRYVIDVFPINSFVFYFCSFIYLRVGIALKLQNRQNDWNFRFDANADYYKIYQTKKSSQKATN